MPNITLPQTLTDISDEALLERLGAVYMEVGAILYYAERNNHTKLVELLDGVLDLLDVGLEEIDDYESR